MGLMPVKKNLSVGRGRFARLRMPSTGDEDSERSGSDDESDKDSDETASEGR